MTYRDPLAGLAEQVSSKRVLAADRKRRLTPPARALLPEEALRRIDELSAGLGPPDAPLPETMDALLLSDAAGDAVLLAYDQALGALPSLRECRDQVRDPAAPALPEPWMFEEPAQIAFRRSVLARVLDCDASSFLRRWGDFTYLARLEREGARVVFTTTVDAGVVLSSSAQAAEATASVSAFTSTLRASIPRAFRSLELRPERLHHGVGKALGLLRDLPLGDAELDEALLVEGAPVSVGALTDRVREGLRALLSFGPRLFAGGGIVELGWRGRWTESPEAVLPDAAFDAVLGVREALLGR